LTFTFCLSFSGQLSGHVNHQKSDSKVPTSGHYRTEAAKIFSSKPLVHAPSGDEKPAY